MQARTVSRKGLGVIAVAIAASFVLGIFASSYFLGSQNTKDVYSVGDSYPYGECVGTCPEHGFTFSEDIVTVTVIHQGEVVFAANYPNIITNAGEDLISTQTACGANLPVTTTTTTSTSSATTTTTTSTTTSATTTSNQVVCGDGGVYIALSTDTATPLATDTSCPSEQTTNGLSRTLGTFTHTTGTNTHTITASFIYQTSASSTTISKVCMFNAASGGVLFAESLLSPSATVSAVGDNVTIQWTFTH